MSNSDDKIEILSKMVIQLKSTQNETTKLLTTQFEKLSLESVSAVEEIKKSHKQEVDKLNDDVSTLKISLERQDRVFSQQITEIKNRMEKENLELREDMLKLLRKYESKFQTQDDEIDSLKQKCELAECAVCKFESFKVHFFACMSCSDSGIVCSNCLQTCKNCKKTACLNCLEKCPNCTELLCKDCKVQCETCNINFCSDCYDNCVLCEKKKCKKCLESCRKCEKAYCKSCAAKCEKCDAPVSCSTCFEKDKQNERCLCGKLYCFNCEDECEACTIPCVWENDSRIFKGFHIKSKNVLPSKCLVKLNINTKGVDTTHLGLTTDSEFKSNEMPTENFWSMVANTGEKFSTVDYKKKGTSFTKYAVPCKEGDTVYIRYFNGDVRFLINRKEYPSAFFLDKTQKLFLYCLTHDDSTNIEIRSMKVYK